MDKIEIRQKKLEYLAGTKFDDEEWVWYNENKNSLNAKAQARWNLAWKLAEEELSEIEKIDALYEPLSLIYARKIYGHLAGATKI